LAAARSRSLHTARVVRGTARCHVFNPAARLATGTSQDALKANFTGIAKELQSYGFDDMDYEHVLKEVKRR